MKEFLASWIIIQLAVIGILFNDCNAEIFGKQLRHFPPTLVPLIYFMPGEVQTIFVNCNQPKE